MLPYSSHCIFSECSDAQPSSILMNRAEGSLEIRHGREYFSGTPSTPLYGSCKSRGQGSSSAAASWSSMKHGWAHHEWTQPTSSYEKNQTTRRRRCSLNRRSAHPYRCQLKSQPLPPRSRSYSNANLSASHGSRKLRAPVAKETRHPAQQH